jgi:threonyl-tRNA synthetase
MEPDAARGHRHWLQQLELAHFEPTSPGMPYWLPRGMVVMRALREMWLREHMERGYVEMSGPELAQRALFATSGHDAHYADGMFWTSDGLGVKPMNCPGAMVVYGSRRRSYRELPLRLYCEDTIHRRELSGVLNGVLRVQEFHTDDGHIFLPEEQVPEELGRVFDLTRDLYARFGLDFRLRLGTAPRARMGDDAVWDRATAMLRAALDRWGEGRAGSYEIAPGEGSFYAPKIDILMTDALGREWQTGTLQVDLQLPERFGCRFAAEDGERVPALIHRAIAGSFERFLGILLEHTDGRLPPVLSPVQVLLVPVGKRHLEAAAVIGERMRRAGLRVEVESARRTVSAAVRDAAARRIPRVAVVGDRELQSGRPAVREEGGAPRSLTPDELAAELRSVRRLTHAR